MLSLRLLQGHKSAKIFSSKCRALEPGNLVLEGISTWSRFSLIPISATPWTIARQAPLSMGFSRQECWSGLPFLPPGDLPDSGIEPESLGSPLLAGRLSLAPPGKPTGMYLVGLFSAVIFRDPSSKCGLSDAPLSILFIALGQLIPKT